MQRRKNSGALVGSFGQGPQRAKPTGSQYRFKLIAETGEQYAAFGKRGPSLSVHGEGLKIAFVAPLATGETGVFCSDGTTITPIVSTAGSNFTAIDPAVSVNALGSVMFIARGPTEEDTGVFVSNGGTVSKLFDAPAESTVGLPLQTSDYGFVISAESSEGGFVIADSSDGVVKRAYPFTGRYEPFHTTIQYGPAALNNAGTLAFYAAGSDGVSFGIFTGNGGAITPVATHEKFSKLGQCVAVSNAGAVVFAGTLINETGEGIYVGVGGGVRKVAGVGDGVFESFGLADEAVAVSIDDGGNVAFLARLVSGGIGIYTGPNAADRLIGTGDSLFDSVVTDLRFNTQSMDAGGNITFGATLTDGRSVIAIAQLPQSKAAGETVVASTRSNAPRVRKRRQGNDER